MTTLREGNLEHRFDSSWTASKYDEWPFYRKHFDGAFGGNKAVDFVAQDSSETLWLVELKDYRVYPRTKSLELAEEIAVKVRDSLAGLFAAAVWHSDHAHRADAQRHLRARSFRIVLHLEQPERHSKLFPRLYDLSRLQEKLKQLVKVVDAHPRVVELGTSACLPWSVASVPGGQD